MLTQEEIAHIFIQTMQAHAEARPYDWAMLETAKYNNSITYEIFWLTCFIGLAGILASLAVAYYAYQLNKKQIDIATQQSKISKEQTEIAKKQSEIMEQQNNISLFDKQYELYSFLRKLHYFSGQQKIVLENLSVPQSIPSNQKVSIFVRIFPKLIKFTSLLSVHREFEDCHQKVYNKYREERKAIPINNKQVSDISNKLDYLKKSTDEYQRLFEDCHIELINTIAILDRIIILFELSKSSFDELRNIQNKLEDSFRDIHDEKISVEKYKEKIIELCSAIEVINIFDEMQAQINRVINRKKSIFPK